MPQNVWPLYPDDILNIWRKLCDTDNNANLVNKEFISIPVHVSGMMYQWFMIVIYSYTQDVSRYSTLYHWYSLPVSRHWMCRLSINHTSPCWPMCSLHRRLLSDFKVFCFSVKHNPYSRFPVGPVLLRRMEVSHINVKNCRFNTSVTMTLIKRRKRQKFVYCIFVC